MPVNIALLGLNRVGISATMALTAMHSEIRCRAWDARPEKRKAAEGNPAFSKVERQLKDTILQTDLVLLALAPEILKRTLAEMKGTLPAGAVLINLSALHASAHLWAEEFIGKEVNFVSLLPALNPDTFIEMEGQGTVRVDLFKGSEIFISSSPTTEAAVLDLAADTAILLGGTPIFADPMEVDGLIAGNLLLPKLAAALAMQTVSGQPSWREGAQIAGRALAQMTTPLEEEIPDETAQYLLYNQENLIRLLNDMLLNIQALQVIIQAGDVKKLEEWLTQNREERNRWMTNRLQPPAKHQFATSIPTEKQALERFLRLGA